MTDWFLEGSSGIAPELDNETTQNSHSANAPHAGAWVYGAGMVEGDRLIPDQSKVAALRDGGRRQAHSGPIQTPELSGKLFLPFPSAEATGSCDSWEARWSGMYVNQR